MKRLTKRWGEEPYPNLAGRVVCEYKECDSAKSCNDCVHGRIANRLAAIEDILGDDYDLDRLRELVEADRDGRCVALPCKRHDILWTFFDSPAKTVYSFYVTDISTLNGRTMLNTDIAGIVDARDIGKTVFRTRAEAALKAREQND